MGNGKSVVTSLAGAFLMGAAPEIYRDVKRGLSNLAGRVKARRDLQRNTEEAVKRALREPDEPQGSGE